MYNTIAENKKYVYKKSEWFLSSNQFKLYAEFKKRHKPIKK